VILYGSGYWNEIINFQALARHGMISREDLQLFEFADDPEVALNLVKGALDMDEDETTPAFAESRCTMSAHES
jgi:predicted Rossmann-fold nucleotide-binding protein